MHKIQPDSLKYEFAIKSLKYRFQEFYLNTLIAIVYRIYKYGTHHVKNEILKKSQQFCFVYV